MTAECGRPHAERSVHNERWVRSPAVHAAELDGETVVYDPARRRLHLLNSSATAIWAALDGVTTCQELVPALAEAFAVDPDVLHDQVDHVLGTLSEEGLIQAAGRGGPQDARPSR